MTNAMFSYKIKNWNISVHFVGPTYEYNFPESLFRTLWYLKFTPNPSLINVAAADLISNYSRSDCEEFLVFSDPSGVSYAIPEIGVETIQVVYI